MGRSFLYGISERAVLRHGAIILVLRVGVTAVLDFKDDVFRCWTVGKVWGNKKENIRPGMGRELESNWLRNARGQDVGGYVIGHIGWQPILLTVMLITNVHHDNETTFATTKDGLDNLSSSLVMAVRIEASKFGAACSSMVAAVLTIA